MSVKTIIITGASSGIGLETAKLLLKNNFKLALFAQNMKPVEKLALMYPENVKLYQTNLLNNSEIETNIIQTINDFVTIDGFIHSAGIGVFGSLSDVSLQNMNNSIQINLNSAMYITKLILPKLIEQKQGKLIFINSIASKNIFSEATIYGTSKAALKMFADSLREEIRGFNISVSSIYPGATKTPWWAGTPMENEKMTQPMDIAKAILNIFKNPDSAVIEDIILRRIEGNF